jgi:nucleoside-diphosphate-sugar epimerase
VAQANFLALTRKEAESKIINVCYGNQVSVNYLFSEISRILNSEIKPEYRPKIEGEVEKFYPDNKLLFKTLGWKPEVYISQGIQKTIDYYRVNH